MVADATQQEFETNSHFEYQMMSSGIRKWQTTNKNKDIFQKQPIHYKNTERPTRKSETTQHCNNFFLYNKTN